MLELCVIFGGQSPEHEISRKSVTSVLNNLNKDKYNISTIGITKNGAWYLYTGDYAKIESGEWEQDTENKKKAILSPDAEDKAILVFDGDKVTKIHPDVIFPVLHGEFGEDGTIQGLFELSGIPYVGMGVMASANGMDKTSSKIVFARTGSSVGVGKAHDRKELKAALENAAQFDRKILVEENIDGHEVECAVLGNEDVKAATVGEIMPTVEFYDFDAKYNDNSTELQIPADLPKETIEQIREYAVRAFKALDGSGLSRVDFFVKHSDGSVVLNEINTLPGFTNISMYPKLWGAVGIEYSELLDKLIELAEKRVK